MVDEQASSSDDGQFLVALRKMMKKEVEVMVIRTFQQVIVPTIGDLVRKIVKEEIQSLEKTLLTRGTQYPNDTTMSRERSLQLKFLDEVSAPVLTGKPLRGKAEDSLSVALIDRATGQVSKSGPGSSAKVEILFLDASDDDDNEHNWTLDNFNNRIIRVGDKKKPHFAKNIYMHLKEGVGVLSNTKLGHDSNWMRSCQCRLGARVVEDLRGLDVQEARTESFVVVDSRSKLYGKHYPPSLSDEVWRLDNIGRDGGPLKRLNENKICTVQDFLFLLSIDPQRLQRIVGAGAKMWKTTVGHAQTCVIDDKRLYLHNSHTESTTGVVFDVVGGLKGVTNGSHYVPVNNLSSDEKDCAHNLLLSAFENRERRISFDDESSLLQRFPCSSRDVDASTNLASNIHENIDGVYPIEPSTSSQSITGYISRSLDHSNDIDPLGLPQSMLGDPTHFPSYLFPPDLENNIFHFGFPPSPTTGLLHEQNPIYQFSCPDLSSDRRGDNWSRMPLINSKTLSAESLTHHVSSDRAYPLVGPVVNALLWVVRAKKRVVTLGDVHVHKKQRI